MRFPGGYNDNPSAPATIMLLLFPGSFPFLLSSTPAQTCVCLSHTTYLSLNTIQTHFFFVSQSQSQSLSYLPICMPTPLLHTYIRLSN
ncbi:hypothetical protein Fmac_023855 [Flemingia macrophylla]|uniref:Uncharacterized protein n=1 Tax=Flemingia macrophylla TaxID=520843 RepID=A0ABD1LMR2_9FABA